MIGKPICLACTLVASPVVADRLDVLKSCLHVSDGYRSAAILYSETSTPANRIRIERLPQIAGKISLDVKILEIAGGTSSKAALQDIGQLTVDLFGGSVFGVLEKDVVACRTPDRNYDCKPYLAALFTSANLLEEACAQDYQSWDDH